MHGFISTFNVFKHPDLQVPRPQGPVRPVRVAAAQGGLASSKLHIIRTESLKLIELNILEDAAADANLRYSGYTLDILWIFLDVVWTHIMAVKCCKGYNTLVQLYI